MLTKNRRSPVLARSAAGFASAVVLLAAACPSCEDPPLLDATYALCVAPVDVDFGEQLVRTEETRIVAITNCGQLPIFGIGAVLTGVDGDDSQSDVLQIVATQIALPVQPGAQFTLPVRFRPRDARAHEAALVLQIDDVAAETTTVPVVGVGVAHGTCDVLIGPDPVAFGPVLLGESVSQDITITNQGTTDCALSAARVTLEQSDFFEVAVPPPAVVAPGESVTATVRFSPSVPGARSGRFAVVVDGGVEIVATLDGTGVSRDACVLTAVPTPIALPRAAIGIGTTQATTVLTSVGELPCTVSGVLVDAAIAAADFTLLQRPDDGTVLAPGETALVTIDFAPTVPGPRSAALVVDTVEGTRLSVPVSAFADPSPTCALLFDPGTVSFAPIGVGLSVEGDVTFTNASNVTCDLDGVALTPGSAPDFALVDVDAPDVLTPGSTGTARVRFTAPRASPSLGRLAFTLGGNVTSSVDLLGFGDFAELVLTPGFVPFGTVTSGCASDTTTFTVTNVGPVAGRIDDVAFTAATDPNFEFRQTIPAATMIPPGASLTLQTRMLGAVNPGSHHGRIELRSTGGLERVEVTELAGRTESVEDAARRDVFTQSERPVIDILWVIDNSGSMGEEQANLTQNFSEFIRFTTELDIDYQIGVITTDATGPTAGRLVGPIIANTGANASSDPVGDFVRQASVGINGNANEQGLLAAVKAVTEPNRSGSNAGFLRENALLSIIYVSDEQDSSPGDVTGYIDSLLDAKGRDPDAVIASAIAGDVPGGCDSTAGDAQAGTRYLDIVTALRGVFASICAVDWSTTMEEIGLGTFQALTRFRLSREPDLSTMVVIVDGVVIPRSDLNGWSYDETTNSVKFNGTAVPEAGEEIAIEYTAECIAP